MNCALCITSCTSDDQASGIANGEPITFTAAGIATPTTRSTVTGDWEGLNGKTVGVMIDSEVKEYNITLNANDNKTATLSNTTDPFYWNSATETKTVTAWYPKSASKDGSTFTYTIAQDQSGDGYANSDILAATKEISYGKTALTFTHQVAKITIILKKGDGITTNDLANATIYIYDGSQYIKTNSGSALVAPTILSSGDNLVKITLNGGNTFIGSLTNAPTWKSSNAYTYTFTVSYNAVMFERATIGNWEDQTKVDINGKVNEVVNFDYVTAEELTYEYLASVVINGRLTVAGTYDEAKMIKVLDYVRTGGENNNIITVDLSGVTGMEALKVVFNEQGDLVKYETTFMNSTSLQKVVLPTSVTDISYAFFDCEKLTTVDGLDNVTNAYYAFANTALTAAPYMPKLTKLIGTFTSTGITEYKNDNITECGYEAFYSCSKLTTVYLPNITSIDMSAFYQCTSLESFEIPSGVTSIGEQAFFNCEKLTTVTCKATEPPTLGDHVFGYYSGEDYNNILFPDGFKIIVPSGTLSAYQEKWSDYANYIEEATSR